MAHSILFDASEIIFSMNISSPSAGVVEEPVTVNGELPFECIADPRSRPRENVRPRLTDRPSVCIDEPMTLGSLGSSAKRCGAAGGEVKGIGVAGGEVKGIDGDGSEALGGLDGGKGLGGGKELYVKRTLNNNLVRA